MSTRSLSIQAWLVVLGLPLLFAGCAEVASPTQTVPASAAGVAARDDETAAGRAALGRRDFDTARQHFANVLTAARRAGDQPRMADALFYLGLTAQQSAAGRPNPEAALATARGYYNDAIKVRPDFPAALNNLAEVHLAEKNSKGAGDALLRAMALGGSREGIYAQKYADLALQEGNWKNACNHYARAAELQPDNDAVHRQLVDLCLKFDPPALIGYLWGLAMQGQVLQVQRIAIEMLPRSGWSDENHDDFMTIIAVCLSRQNYRPADFPETEAAALLRKLPGDPAIRELFDVHQGERLSPDQYPWWAKRIRRNAEPPRVALWPQEAFRELVRSLAVRSRAMGGGEEKAIDYYRLAAFLDSREPDPEALTRLAELYGGTQRLDELTEVMNRHENEIFSAKGAAYEANKLEKIYQFHSALGVIYSNLGVWGDDRTPTSAIFQLEQATKIAQRATSVRPPSTSPKPGVPPTTKPALPIQPAPQLVNLLADAYVRTNNPAKAFDLKVDQGQQFFRAGDVAAAREVLRGVDKVVPAAVSPVQKATFEKLQRDIPDLNAPRKSVQLRNTTPTTATTMARAGSTSVPAKTPVTSAATTTTAAASRVPAAVPATSAAVPAKVPVTSSTAPSNTSASRTPATVPATSAASAAKKVPATASTSSQAVAQTPVANLPAKSRVPLRVVLVSTPGVDSRKLAALTTMVKTLVAKPAGTATVQALPKEAIALNVQEIVLQGGKGTLTIKEGTKTITVPITIEGGDLPRSSSATRYVRR